MARLPILTDPNFKGAKQNCGFCKDFCEKENYYNPDGNVHSRQTLVYLRAIKNSDVARKAEELCKQCDYRFPAIINDRSPGIINLLDNHWIRL